MFNSVIFPQTTSMNVVVVVVVLLSLGHHIGAVTHKTGMSDKTGGGLEVEGTCLGTTANTSQTFGVIHSPPLKHTGEGGDIVRCIWSINNPHRQPILLRFTQFALSNSECRLRKCCREWVCLYTGGEDGKRNGERDLFDSCSLSFVFESSGMEGDEDRRMCEDNMATTLSYASTIFVEYCYLGQMSLIFEGGGGGGSVWGNGGGDGGSGGGFSLMYMQVNTAGCIQSNQFRCGSLPVCVPVSRMCDGNTDCPNNYDEFNCPSKEQQQQQQHITTTPTTTTAIVYKELDGGCGNKNLLWCGVGTECYSESERCDTAKQCSNAKDELNCSAKCPFQIPCWGSDECYFPYQRCDGLPDCTDGTDEDNCMSYQCNQQNGTYLCDNNRCIRETWKCDELDDCRDGSDERQCIRNSVIGVAVIGGLLCSLLLIIALGCSGRLYALRSGLTRLSTGSSHRDRRDGGERGGARPPPSTPRSRLDECLSQRELPPPYHVAVNDTSGFLHRAWGSSCHPPWRLPQQDAPPLPSLSPSSPHQNCQQGEKDEEDVPLLSEEGGGSSGGEGGDDVSLLDDLFTTSGLPPYDLESDTRAAVLALSAVQCHINSMENTSDTEMI